MEVVRVFTNEKGQFGNPVGIVLDLEQGITPDKRQSLAFQSGFSEVVFVNDLESKSISIFSPQREIPFAGHAVVGTAYFLQEKYHEDIHELLGIEGKIKTWTEKGRVWVRGELSIAPPWNYEFFDSPKDVEKLTVDDMSSKEHVVAWSWIDKEKGFIRARTFAADWGIPEDQANGSGSMVLAANLKQELQIKHGEGSVIYAKPFSDNFADVGGLSVLK